MDLQIIKSMSGKDEYALLPVSIYYTLRAEINAQLQQLKNQNGYVCFESEDYSNNPVALARIKAGITQEHLANCLGVSQAYISKLERQSSVTARMLNKVENALATVGCRKESEAN
ncbi:MAG TPA: helix-turn-helix transcriptional regulator [Gammaproteobacteria bacterium]|nr:helix-turn-helix transcriptional regulator [Gammaproteobacteria bacterium]